MQISKSKILYLILTISFFLTPLQNIFAQAIDETLQDDADLFQKYSLCQKYEKKQKYKKYEKYIKNKKKYGFNDSTERLQYKDFYNKYKLYKKDKIKYRAYAQYYEQYKKYNNYKKYVDGYKKYSKYKNYKKYNKNSYNDGKNYCGDAYKAGYDRHKAAQIKALAEIGEADLGDGPITGLGPQISIGLVEYSKSNLQDSSFNIYAFSAASGDAKTRLDYDIKDSDGNVLATVLATAPVTQTKVKYLSGNNFRIYDSVTPEITASGEVRFEAHDSSQASDIVFDFNRPSSDYDTYRGSMRLRYYNNPDATDTIWAINVLPLEEYVWGMGEMTGTGDADHSNVMTTVFRTYGYWKMKFSTKYSAQGFKVNATPGNQLYYGYDWEKAHSGIKTAAEATQGKIVMYLNGSGLNEVTLTPYSSWTDGQTRSFEEKWGSTAYPWCQSVSDPYGKHATMTTQQLFDSGNHMVGLSAHGSLKLATDYSWNWTEILGYYFHAINLRKAY